jgi:hypothetical protein
MNSPFTGEGSGFVSGFGVFGSGLEKVPTVLSAG